MIRSLPLALRRVRQTVSAFDNGASVLAALAGGAVLHRPDELTFDLDELSITCPNVAGARVPVYEVFAEDAYRLEWFTGDLGDAPKALDIGGHIGCFSMAFARLHERGRVATYEASPQTYQYLTRNIGANGFADRVHINNVAVSSREGTLTFRDNAGASGLNGITSPEATTVEIPCTTFARARADAGGDLDVVKIDTEGAEYDIVLATDADDWAGIRRVVLEYHPVPDRRWSQLREFFEAAGFGVVRHEPVNEALGTAWLSREPGPAPS